MKKHGVDNFTFTIIATCKTPDDANELETLLVAQYQSHISTGKGYNVSYGGYNAPKTPEWKAYMSKLFKGREWKWTKKENLSLQERENRRVRMLGNTYAKGNSPANIAATEARRGIPLSESHKAKLSQANKGKKLTEEHKARVSASKMGPLNPMFGKKSPHAIDLTPEQIEIVKSNQYSQRTLAKMFGVSRTKIQKVQREYGIDPKLNAEFYKGQTANQTSFKAGRVVPKEVSMKSGLARRGKTTSKRFIPTPEQLALVLSGNYTQMVLAKMLGVSTRIIKRIKREHKNSC